MRPLKIALVCDWFLPRIGGIEINMKDLALNLKRRGHEVHVITALPGPKWVDGIRVHRLKVPVIPHIKLCYGRRSLKALRTVLETEKYDLIHGHYLLSILTHISFYLGRQLRIPTVFTHHSINGPLHNRVALFLLPYIGTAIGTLLFQKFMRARDFRPDEITGVSEAVAIDLRKAYRTENVGILPNGIDPDLWRLDKSPHQKMTITSVMRLCKSKHPTRLISAIPQINDRLPLEMRPLFHVIGEGGERRHMVKQIEKLGLQSQVKLFGYKPRAEIPMYLAKSDLFVLPSTREGFGLAVLEARSAGLPVIAMNHGGVNEIIQNGVDGFLTNSYDEFAEKIAAFIKDEHLRNRLTIQAGRPLNKLTWNDVILRHLTIYQRAIAKHPKPLFHTPQVHESLPYRRYGT